MWIGDRGAGGNMSSLIPFFSHSTSNAAAHHVGSDIQNYIQNLTNSHQLHHSHSSPQRPSLSYTTVFSNWLSSFCLCTLIAPHLQQQVWSFKNMSDHDILYSKSSCHLPSHSEHRVKFRLWPVRPCMNWPLMFCEKVKQSTWALRTFVLAVSSNRNAHLQVSTCLHHSLHLGLCLNGNSSEKTSLVTGSKQPHHPYFLLQFFSELLFLSNCCLVAKLCLTFLWPYGLFLARLLYPDFPGKNTGVGCHFLLQDIFLTQRSNLSLLHCRQTLYHGAT